MWLAWVDVVQHNHLACLGVSQAAAVANALRIMEPTTDLPDNHFQKKIVSKLNLAVERPLLEVDHC